MFVFHSVLAGVVAASHRTLIFTFHLNDGYRYFEFTFHSNHGLACRFDDVRVYTR